MTVATGFRTLPRLLDEAARAHGENIALEDTDGCRLTYAALDDLTSRLAGRLKSLGVERGDRVGICMPKSINSIVCIFGALRAGAAYVPADYSAPMQRNRFIFENCQTRVICADEPRASLLSEEGLKPELVVFPGDSTTGVGAPWLDEADTLDDRVEVDEADLAYILYTSGSTGVPKGVTHTHASAASFVRWAAETIEPRSDDRFSSHAPFHFDLSILDLYVPLTAGAAIVLVGEELGKAPQELAPCIAERRISIWYSVPSILAMLAEYGRLERHDYSALRTVLFAGEVFPIKHLQALRRQWPKPVYYNLYGPTETNVCTACRLPDDIDEHRQTPYPIGPACSNVRALVLDQDGRPVERNGEGLLHIHASGPVMKGYWGDEQRTRDAFYTDEDGERWYNTGDVVTLDEEGNFNYLGRRDRMVKRRGYRIELGEVESGIYRHPRVREAAAVARTTDEGVSIVVFYTSDTGEKLSIIELKQFSMKNLPSYMLPDRFVFMPEMPRTSTDKVDYQSLLRQAQS